MGHESRVTSHESRTTILFLIVLSLLITIPAWAQKAGRKLNVISGEVSAVSKDFIAVVYRSDKAKGSEEEIALPVANDAVVEHKQSLSQIGIGDMVDVEYEEYIEETPMGQSPSGWRWQCAFCAPRQNSRSLLPLRLKKRKLRNEGSWRIKMIKEETINDLAEEIKAGKSSKDYSLWFICLGVSRQKTAILTFLLL